MVTFAASNVNSFHLLPFSHSAFLHNTRGSNSMTSFLHRPNSPIHTSSAADISDRDEFYHGRSSMFQKLWDNDQQSAPSSPAPRGGANTMNAYGANASSDYLESRRKLELIERKLRLRRNPNTIESVKLDDIEATDEFLFPTESMAGDIESRVKREPTALDLEFEALLSRRMAASSTDDADAILSINKRNALVGEDTWFEPTLQSIESRYQKRRTLLRESLAKDVAKDPRSIPENCYNIMEEVLIEHMEQEIGTAKLNMQKEMKLQEIKSRRMLEQLEQELQGISDELDSMVSRDASAAFHEKAAAVKTKEIVARKRAMLGFEVADNQQQQEEESTASLLKRQMELLQQKEEAERSIDMNSVQIEEPKKKKRAFAIDAETELKRYFEIKTAMERRGEYADEKVLQKKLNEWKNFVELQQERLAALEEEEVRMMEMIKQNPKPAAKRDPAQVIADMNRFALESLETSLAKQKQAGITDTADLEARITELRHSLEAVDYVDIIPRKPREEEDLNAPVDLSDVFPRQAARFKAKGSKRDNQFIQKKSKKSDNNFESTEDGGLDRVNDVIQQFNTPEQVDDSVAAHDPVEDDWEMPPPPNSPFFQDDIRQEAAVEDDWEMPPPPNSPFFQDDGAQNQRMEIPQFSGDVKDETVEDDWVMPPPPNSPFFATDEVVAKEEEFNGEDEEYLNSLSRDYEEQRLQNIFRQQGAFTPEEQNQIRAAEERKAQFRKHQEDMLKQIDEKMNSLAQNAGVANNESPIGLSTSHEQPQNQRMETPQFSGDVKNEAVSTGEDQEYLDSLSRDYEEQRMQNLFRQRGAFTPEEQNEIRAAEERKAQFRKHQEEMLKQFDEGVNNVGVSNDNIQGGTHQEPEKGMEIPEFTGTSDINNRPEERDTSGLGTYEEQKTRNMLYKQGHYTKEAQEKARIEYEKFQKYQEEKLRELEEKSVDELKQNLGYDVTDLLTEDGDVDAEKVLSYIHAKAPPSSETVEPVSFEINAPPETELVQEISEVFENSANTEDELLQLEEKTQSMSEVISASGAGVASYDNTAAPANEPERVEETQGSFLGSEVANEPKVEDENQVEDASYNVNQNSDGEGATYFRLDKLPRYAPESEINFFSSSGSEPAEYEARKAAYLERHALSLMEVNSLMDMKDSSEAMGFNKYVPRINRAFKEFGAIFRLEGVLVDISALESRVWGRVAEIHGFEIPTHDEVRRATLHKPEYAVKRIFRWSMDIWFCREVGRVHDQIFREEFDVSMAKYQESAKAQQNQNIPQANQAMNQFGGNPVSPVQPEDNGAHGVSIEEVASALSRLERNEITRNMYVMFAERFGLPVPSNEELSMAVDLSAQRAIELFGWAGEGVPVDRVLRVLKETYDEEFQKRAQARTSEMRMEQDLIDFTQVEEAEEEQDTNEDFQLTHGSQKWIKSLIEKEMPVGLVSYFDSRTVEVILEQTGLKQYFSSDRIVTASSGYDRDSYEQLGAAVRIDRRPDMCVLFDGNGDALLSSRELEMKSVGMTNIYPSYELLGADTTAREFDFLTAMNIRRVFGDRENQEPQLEENFERPPPIRRQVMTMYPEDDRGNYL